MKAIEIKALEKRYGQVKALDGLDLTVETGSVFGFLGPNGAGKTTTLRILTGLANASGGAGFRGRCAGERPAWRYPIWSATCRRNRLSTAG